MMKVAMPITVPPPKSSDAKWNTVMIVVMMACMTMIAIAALLMMGGKNENTPQLFITILGFAATTTASLLAYARGKQNSDAIQDVHVILNSRLSELIAKTEREALLQGAKNQRETIGSGFAEPPTTSSQLPDTTP